MKNLITISIAAGLLAITPSALLAQDATNSTPNAGQTTTPTPDKAALRKQVLTILGISRADLKGLTPADRRSKIKEALDTKITALEQKQTAGTLTTQEKSDLATLQQFQSAGHHKSKSDS